MALEVGSRLGHYDVTALIGEGGMGQVYQATDTKLNRQVALKILPEAFATDPDRLARFQREAQVLASLNHPNIAAIHGLEDSEGTKALVLELVEGPTLADRIKQGPIAIDEALPIAKQIAEALEAAHEAGVIHRDLKPANIKVKDDGTVKVLDFGLAKALDPSPDADPSQSPTLTAAATQMGVIMGTAAYMSPEQAAGQTADRRSDIWSFGVVLFEMLTGQRLFTGETVSHVLASVLKTEPNWEMLPATTSEPLRRVLRRSLAKERKRRLSDVTDALLDLDEATRAPARVVASEGRAGWRQALPLATAVSLVVGVLVAAAVWSLTRPDAPQPQSLVRFPITPPGPDVLSVVFLGPSVAVSHDGETVVYAAARNGVRQLYRRSLDQLDAVPISGTEGAQLPFVSPDGEWVGFELDGTLRKVALAGGPPATLYDGSDVVPTDATWGTNDQIVFGSRGSNHLMQVAATGGVAEPVTTLGEGERDHRQPQLLPGGTTLLFSVEGVGDTSIAVKSLTTGERRNLLAGSTPRYTMSGHIVFALENALWAVPFDVERLVLTGDPVPVMEGVAIGPTGFAQFTAARNGSLVYVTTGGISPDAVYLVWVDREGNEELVAAEPGPYRGLAISRDGERVVAQVSNPDNTDLVIYDLARDTPTRFTFDPALDTFPVWTPDGERVVFGSDRDGALNLYWKAADGTGQVERLMTSEDTQVPSAMSPDDPTVLFIIAVRPETGRDVGLLSLDGERTIEWLLESDADESYPAVSPDGRWMAYVSTESGQSEVYVRPFPNVSAGRWQVSRDGGTSPLWGPDSRELFFQTGDAPGVAVTMMVAVNDTEPTFVPGIPRPLFEGPYGLGRAPLPRPYDVSPDGQRFLIIRSGSGIPGTDRPEIIVVQNWFEELTRLVPTN